MREFSRGGTHMKSAVALERINVEKLTDREAKLLRGSLLQTLT